MPKLFKLEEEITKFKYLVEADDLNQINQEAEGAHRVIEEENVEESDKGSEMQSSESMMRKI